MTTFASVRVELARARADGATFDAAWRDAIAQAVDPDVRAALHATVDAWRAAWDHEPADRRLHALAALGSDPDRVVKITAAERWCERCDGLIPPDRRNGAKFCSDECRRDRRVVTA